MGISLEKKLTRLLVLTSPITGELSLQAQWTDVITTSQGEVSTAIPQSLISTNYSSLEEADQRAIAFREFSNLAVQFQTQPFTAITGLLEALKDYQPESTPLSSFPFPQNPPFEGAP